VPELYAGGMGFLRRYRAPVVLLAIALLVGVVAIADHRWKQRRIERVEVEDWFCRHRGIDCTRASVRTMERHWNERQVVYEVVVASLGIAGITLAARRALDR
jgi:hypothetical protein